MMKTKILIGIISFFAIFIISSCLKNDDEELQNAEQAKLANYIKNHSEYTLTQTGLYFHETKAGSGLTPADSDYVLINTTWYLLEGIMVRTSDTILANTSGAIPFISYKGPLKIYLPGYVKGISEGIAKMKEGGISELIVPSKLAFDGYDMVKIPRYSTLKVVVELVRVIKDPIADDNAFIKQYIDTLGLRNSDLDGGIYMKVDSIGTGDVPESYDTVTIQYREKSLDTAFSFGKYEYRTSKYIVDKDSILPGLRTAIMKLNKGSEARFILPYNVAWGAGGFGRVIDQTDILIDIPPYTSFYYQIIIKDIGRSFYYKK